MKVEKVRDLSIIDIKDEYIVIAVDSFGGIGPKKHDVVKFSVEKWAKALLMVPFMEVIATGATPILVIDALGVEYNPTGKEVVEALKRELDRLGYPNLPLNGSTEDNIPVTSSAAGMVVIGHTRKDGFYPGSSRDGDKLFVVGIPKSGPDDEVDLEKDPEIPDILDLIRIRKLEDVHDILPVGSHGILYEALEMAKIAALNLKLSSQIDLDIRKSAGPSTCFLFSTTLSMDEVKEFVDAPISQIGILVKD